MTIAKKKKQDYICSRILQYGKAALESHEFKRAESEVHHVHSSVKDHTLNVAITGTSICRLLKKMHVDIREDDVIRASLCHDLGMLGREHRYDSPREARRDHPAESVVTARRIFPDLSPNAEEVIRSHMWPMGDAKPDSREGFVVILSDKYASVIDWISYFTGRKYKSAIKKRLSPATR